MRTSLSYIARHHHQKKKIQKLVTHTLIPAGEAEADDVSMSFYAKEKILESQLKIKCLESGTNSGLTAFGPIICFYTIKSYSLLFMESYRMEMGKFSSKNTFLRKRHQIYQKDRDFC